jgi:tRNA threonylcarbamoyl adenosine modification protein YeaZ
MYLAIDTSSETTGLALIRDGQILAGTTWHCDRNHTVELLPHLEEMLKKTALNIKDIKGIIVARGPGSFNGLRVGLGTAKGLAFSLNVPIVGIGTLEAAAYQFADSGLPACAVFTAGTAALTSPLPSHMIKDKPRGRREPGRGRIEEAEAWRS